MKNYSLEALLTGSPAESFITQLSEVRNSMHWYSHETDLLRCLILYKWGGVYVMIVRPVDTLKLNVVAWQLKKGNRLNGTFMIIGVGSKFEV